MAFKPKSEWDAGNKGLNEGLTKLLVTLKNEKQVSSSKGSNTEWKPNSRSCRAKTCQKDRGYDFRLVTWFGFFEQLHQLIFPQAGDGVAAVAARFVAEWNHDRAAVRHALDLALEDPELGRIDQVVGRIDRQQAARGFFPGSVRDRNRVKLPARRARRLHHQS